MKQHGIMFATFGVGYFLWSQLSKRQAGLPAVAAKTLVLIAAEAAPAVTGRRNIMESRRFSQVLVLDCRLRAPVCRGDALADGQTLAWNGRKSSVWQSYAVLVLLAAVGLLAPLWDGLARRRSVFTIFLFVFSFAAACIGLEFRQHYFILAMPATALLIGCCFSTISRAIARVADYRLAIAIPALVLAFGCGLSVYLSSDMFFEQSPGEISRALYGTNPFPEAVLVGDYIKSHSNKGDTVAVLGSEPEIFFYSNRMSATGYIYVYPLMEKQDFAVSMQHGMISEITKARPRYLVFVLCIYSWLGSSSSPRDLTSWMDPYIKQYYHRVGLVDVAAPKPLSAGIWGRDADNAIPLDPNNYVEVFERNRN